MMLGLFHSGESHVPVFTRLVRELDPTIPLRHRVREDLLRDAQGPRGMTPEIRREVMQDLLSLADQGAAVVLCTCTTLGSGAEAAAAVSSTPILRVDRPMMEAALRRGRRIAVAAVLASTVEPTRRLLDRVAVELGVAPEVQEILIQDAWPLFEQEDMAGYARMVAEGIRGQRPDVDALILAQASMAGAADLLADLPFPVLSSPRLGVAAAVAIWHEARARRELTERRAS
jgi:hypothetical protein